MFARRRDSDLRIDMSALIDVVFLLLIFFMVTTTFAEQSAVEIDLPSADGEPSRADAERPEVVVDKAGTVHLDGAVVSLEELTEKLRDRFADTAAGERHVDVRGDATAGWEQMLQVMEALRKAGVGAASGLTEPAPDHSEEPR